MFTLKIENYWQDAVRDYETHSFGTLDELYRWVASVYNSSNQPNKEFFVSKRAVGWIDLNRVYFPKGWCGYYGNLWVKELVCDGITIYDRSTGYCSPKLEQYLVEHPFENLITKKIYGDF